MAVTTLFTIPLYIAETIWKAPLGNRFYLTSRGKIVSNLSGCLEICTLVAYILGNIWIFTSETCINTAPLVYNLSLLWILYGYVMVILPIIYLFLLFFCLPITIHLSRRRSRMDPYSESASIGLSKSQIESIPTTIYQESPEEEDCSICLSPFEPGNTLKTLPKCQHRYHVECIDSWLVNNLTCPLCICKVID